MTRLSIDAAMDIALHHEGKPFAIVLAGHNGSGKSPLWYKHLSDRIRVAMGRHIPFAVETVFSHWTANADGSISSKIDLLKDLQSKGYFVLLVFVGLSSIALSIRRVTTRQRQGGHAVPHEKLRERFPRTQQAIKAALEVADASILFDNSRSKQLAFTPVHIRLHNDAAYDIRASRTRQLHPISSWLNVIVPRQARRATTRTARNASIYATRVMNCSLGRRTFSRFTSQSPSVSR